MFFWWRRKKKEHAKSGSYDSFNSKYLLKKLAHYNNAIFNLEKGEEETSNKRILHLKLMELGLIKEIKGTSNYEVTKLGMRLGGYNSPFTGKDGRKYNQVLWEKYEQDKEPDGIIAILESQIIKSWVTGYTAKSGHIVKSQGEKIIADFLHDNEIRFSYEKALPGDNNYLCDFFIQKGDKSKDDIYIEVWGMDTIEYNKNRKNKEKYYKDNGLKLIDFDKGFERGSKGKSSSDIIKEKLEAYGVEVK